MKKQVIQIELFSKEILIVERSIDDWMTMKTQAKSLWQSSVFISELRRELYFSNIRDVRWKTRHTQLDLPQKKRLEKPKELTDEQRKERDKFLAGILEKTKEGRKKNFVHYRQELLAKLARQEERFWLQTTLNKLEELNDFRKKDIWKKNRELK